MKKRQNLKSASNFLLVMLSLLLLFTACHKKKKEIITEIDPTFGQYISAYTSGLIPANSKITFRFAQPATSFTTAGDAVKEHLFSFSPSIDGKAYWVDAQTIEFRPDKPMKSGEIYTSAFALGKLFDVKDDRFSKFNYSFRIIPQSLSMDFDGLIVQSEDNPDVYNLEGIVQTADEAETEKVAGCFTATYNGSKLEILVEPADEPNNFKIKVKGIKRNPSGGQVEVDWDASGIGGSTTGNMQFDVPATGKFVVISTKVVQAPQQAIYIVFSDLLEKQQGFEGLIDVDGFSQLKFDLSKNVLRIYLPQTVQDVRTLKVYQGIQNNLGEKLSEEFSKTFVFEDVKPGIRPLGKGTILPTSQGLVYPFEAVNLKAVTVEIVKIFENNIPYYMQVNRLGGTSELTRVGYPVFKKVIPLNQLGVIVPNKWTRYTLDMGKLFSADLGAMYQISIKFNRHQLLTPCNGEGKDAETTTTVSFDESANTSGYDGPDYYYDYDYYYDDDYDWRQRDNPCNSAYYSSSKMIKQIILSSDLGVIAKLGNNGGMLVVVADLPSAKPKSGVNVKVTDYQNQVLAEGSTNSDGIIEFKLNRTPFLVTVSDGNQRGYLRVDNGTSNSLSNFDVGGFEVQHGLKGMIYGERGVWRPGDTLHLAFILEDKTNSLPSDHPIIFELRDPKGLLVKKLVQANNQMGMFYFPVATDDQAPTGSWRATVKVGGAVFSKTLNVETIKPNRLKIKLDLDKIPESGVINAPLNVKWLHGAIAANLNAKYEVTVKKGHTTFPNYGNYTFDDPGVRFEQQTYMLWEGQLDNEGNARVAGKIEKPETPPTAINVVFKGRVFEQGGDFSIDLFSKMYYPYSEFVGVLPPKPKTGRGWLETDRDHELSVVTVNVDGKPVSCSDLEMEMYKLTWRWWWEQPDEGEASYVSRSYDKLIIRKRFSTVNGKANVTLRVNYPEWGRYYIKVTNKKTGNSSGTYVYFDWPYDSGKSQADRPGSANVLAIAADKEDCNVGDQVQLTIPGAENARALISIENGSKVISAWWVDAFKSVNVVSVETTPEMSPNVYFHVTLVQPHKGKNNDMPIRLYGITRLNVTDPATILQPIIKMDDELKAEKPVEISVSEKNGKKMCFTLAMVDEGLLDINRFKTPDPHSVFYAREAIGVKTWDLYNDVIGAYGGKLERLISVGGDENLKPNDGEKNQRFKPVVRFFGPYVVEKGKSKKINFTMDNYIGSVRVMVIAANNGAYGMTEKTCPVRNDLMVMATLPRVLGPQEDISLPVNVFTMSPKMKKVTVTVKTSPNISISGEKAKTLSFSEVGDKIIFFNLKVGGASGPAKVEVEAEGNGIKSTQTIDIMVRNPISEVTRSIDTLVPANAKLKLNFSTFGIKGSNAAFLEASVLPPLNLKKRLDDLIHYPHGCVEQTTSAAFPQLYLDKLVELSSGQQGNIDYFVNEAIRKLSQFQNSDGSFRYWPSYVYSDDWSTSYVGHFLIEAQNNGYDVPQGLIANWISYQRRAARGYTYSRSDYRNDDLVQAYRLYTLALAKKAEVGAMNKLKEHDLGLTAKMRLAAAYALIGQDETARSIIQNVPLTVNSYRELSYTYGSTNRDKGIVLETLILLKDDSRAFPIAKEISKVLSGNAWMSTQETAVDLMALSKLSIQKGADNSVALRYSIGNSSKKLSSDKPVAREQLQIADGLNGIVYENNGKKPVYTSIVLTGIPPLGEEKSFESNINMKVVYLSANGSVLNPENLKKGTDFTCEVTISNPGVRGELKEMALTQIFPSGWEIQNARFEGTGNESANNFDYQDIRDDRVITYFSVKPNTSKKFTIKLTATYAGRYYMPGPHCEAMYDNTIAASQKGGWVVVE